MYLACNTVLFAQSSLRDALRYIGLAGYPAAELASIPGMAVHADPEGEAGQVAEEIRASGLVPVAIEAATDLSRAENRPRVVAVFALARRLGISVVTTGSGGKAEESSLAELVPVIRELAQEAERAGVTWALKPHVGSAVHNTRTARALLEGVGVGALGINFDPTHIAREGEDPVAFVHQLAPAIRHVHIRDTASRGAGIGPPEGQIPGNGWLNLAGVAAALRTVGYAGNLTFEVIGARDYAPEAQLAIAARASGYFRRLFAEVGLPVQWEAPRKDA